MTGATGTQLGGDPASIRAVAAWFREHLARQVEDAAAAVDHLLRARWDSWDDSAGRAFGENLANGRRKMDTFAGALRARAAMLDDIAAALEVAEAEMQEAVRLATIAQLTRRDGWIYAPSPRDPIDGQPESLTPDALIGYYNTRHAIYVQVEELAEAAYTRVRSQLVGDSSYDWNKLLFVAGDLVKENAKELIRRHGRVPVSGAGLLLSRQMSPAPLFSSYAAMSRPYGLTARVLMGAGPILTLVGAAYAVYSGEPPQRVVLTTGIAIGAGAMTMWLLPLIFPTIPVWVAAGGGTIAGVAVGEVSGLKYDGSRTARDKLLDNVPDLDPGRSELPGTESYGAR